MKISDFKPNNAVESVTQALEKLEKLKDYNITISTTAERALDRAEQVERGEITGRLAGVPFLAKDNFLVFGSPTTAASKMLASFNAPIQATAIEKLEAEGAICIGKTNLDSFAHGGSTENSAYGPTLNSIDKTRVAGGSSGGSAVAVALDIVPFALGTDTGGSIRQPASFNGVVGVKPTYGAVSRYGVVAMASSTDCIGCFTSNSSDAELVIDIMSGKDVSDMTTLDDFFKPCESSSKTKKIGLVKNMINDDVDEDVRQRIYNLAERLKSAGYTIEDVELPMADYAVAMYYIIVPAEISSNLARYDGVRYGHRSDSPSLAELYGRSRDEGFETENKRRILIGSYVLSSGYFDAYYQQAQRARTLLCQEFDRLFESYDVLLSPVAPTPAFKLGENTTDPIKMYLADTMTIPASLAGLPALSVPAGNAEEGLAVGAQIVGNRGRDSDLLALAKEIEALW